MYMETDMLTAMYAHNPFSLGHTHSGQDYEGFVTVHRKDNSKEGKRSGFLQIKE